MLSHFGGVRLFATPWTAVLQALRILEWIAISSSGDLPDPGIELALLTSLVLAGRFFTTCAKWEIQMTPPKIRVKETSTLEHLPSPEVRRK